MTTERFTIIDNLPKGTHTNIWDKQKQHNQGIGDELWLGEVVAMLNEGVILAEENEKLKQQLQKIQNNFEVNWTQNYVEFNKDKLYIKDNNTEIRLNGTNLFIKVYIPQINQYYCFKYIVTGRSLIKDFIENYNSNGDNMTAKRLLEDIRHELVSIDRWYAFEPTSYIDTEKGHTIINNKEFLIRLDFDELIKRIDKELE